MAIRTLGPGSLVLGETGSPRQWGADVKTAKITPSTNKDDDVPMLDGSNMAGEETTTYTLNGTIQQDYDADSLIEWCWINRGTQQPFVFVPTTAGMVEASGTVTVRPLEVGGDVKTRPTTDFEFAIEGEPTFTFVGPSGS
jgi:hypothetical protein